MMYHKAKLFNDTKSAKEILNTNNPRIIKDIGRRVKNFDEDIWNEHKEKIVQQGNYLKFTQNKYLYNILIDTKDCYLVEASPYDKIWGIGLAPNNDKVLDKKNRKGLNLLGKCIMRARDDILKG